MADSRGGRGPGSAVRALLALSIAGCALVGCGSSTTSNGEINKSPSQILKDAQAATASEPSAHVSGNIVSSGTPEQLDVTAAHGAGGGTISMSGTTLQLVLHQPNAYVRADAASWNKLTNNPAAGQLLAGKWLQTPTSGQFADLAKIADLTELAQNITPTGPLTKGRLTTVNGISVIPLTDSGAKGGTLYVAATGKPVIEVLKSNGTTNSGSVTFDQYGKATVPAVPAGAVSLAQLEQSGT